jgi:hypothetical protein
VHRIHDVSCHLQQPCNEHENNPCCKNSDVCLHNSLVGNNCDEVCHVASNCDAHAHPHNHDHKNYDEFLGMYSHYNLDLSQSELSFDQFLYQLLFAFLEPVQIQNSTDLVGGMTILEEYNEWDDVSWQSFVNLGIL